MTSRTGAAIGAAGLAAKTALSFAAAGSGCVSSSAVDILDTGAFSRTGAEIACSDLFSVFDSGSSLVVGSVVGSFAAADPAAMGASWVEVGSWLTSSVCSIGLSPRVRLLFFLNRS